MSALEVGLYSADGPDEATAAWLADLVANLPRESRLARELDPDCAWSPEAWLLRLIEADLQAVAQRGAKHPKRPRPVKTPAEQEEARESAERARDAMAEVAEAYGLNV